MSACAHESYEPVEVSGGFGGLFDLFSDITVTVAHVCLDCRTQLPAWWGCPDCETVEGPRKLSDAVPTIHLAKPCRRHQEAL